MKALFAALVIASLATTPLSAAACRDAKGKFIKCPPVAKAVRCKDSRGKFAKCGTLGAKPA